jgi:Sec-independent protein translocase protein TatA
VRFGTEILFISVLGGLLFGPRQLTTILGHVAQAKAHFENATHKFKPQSGVGA